MTIQTEIRKAGPYLGDGVNKNFPFAFKIFKPEYLLVVYADPDGIERTLALGSDYTVSLNQDQDSSPGGSITTLFAPPSGYRLVLTSKIPALQSSVFTNHGGFYPALINETNDWAVALIQQLMVDVARAIKVTLTTDKTPDQLLQSIFDSALQASQAKEQAQASAASAAEAATDAASVATSTATTVATTVSTTVATNVATHIAEALVPPGTVMAFLLQSAPAGWIALDGSQITKGVYPKLYEATKTIFPSGQIPESLILPDLRGQFLRGVDNGRGVDPGRAIGSWQKGTLYSYDQGDGGTWSTNTGPTFGYSSQPLMGVDNYDTGLYPGVNIQGLTAVLTVDLPGIVDNAGRCFSGVTRPQNVAVLYCIKT